MDMNALADSGGPALHRGPSFLVKLDGGGGPMATFSQGCRILTPMCVAQWVRKLCS